MSVEGGDIARWLKERSVSEIECMVPDMAGIARGKILPTDKFIGSIGEQTLRLPESIFMQTVTGDMIDSEVMDDTEPDIILAPDMASMRLVPWYQEPTGQVICDAERRDGTTVDVAPRAVLRRVLDLYAERDWRPVVAPELEFYLCEPNIDADYPLTPPKGKSGRPEIGRQSYGIDAVNEFDPLFEEMYDFCEAQGLDVDTLIHESGAAQVEITSSMATPCRSPTRPSSSSERSARRRIVTTFMRRSWPSLTSASQAAPCISIRAWCRCRRARTCSPMRAARTRRCSFRSSADCRSTCRWRWR